MSKALISRDDHISLFRNIDKIYDFQKSFVVHLTAVSADRNTRLDGLSRVLLSWLVSLDDYVEYFLTFKKAATTLESLLFALPAFREFVHGDNQENLEDLLSYPQSHIPRIESFVELLLKFTPEVDSDFEPLIKCLLCLRSAVLLLAKCQIYSESYSLQKSFKRLPKSSSFEIKEFRRYLNSIFVSALVGKKNRSCLLYTFDDCIVLLRRQNSSNVIKFVSYMPLDGLAIQWDSSVDSNGLNVILSSGSQRYILYFDNEKDKKQWMGFIYDIMNTMAPKRQHKLKPILSNIVDILCQRNITNQEIINAVSSVRRVEAMADQILDNPLSIDLSKEETDLLLTLFIHIISQHRPIFHNISDIQSVDASHLTFEVDVSQSEITLGYFFSLLNRLNTSNHRMWTSGMVKGLDKTNNLTKEEIENGSNLIFLLAVFIFRVESDGTSKQEIDYIKLIPGTIDTAKTLAT